MNESLLPLRACTPVFSATVVQVAGSAYRKPGARMLATQGRWLAGSLSAGRLERDALSQGLWRVREGTLSVVAQAQRVLRAAETALEITGRTAARRAFAAGLSALISTRT